MEPSFWLARRSERSFGTNRQDRFQNPPTSVLQDFYETRLAEEIRKAQFELITAFGAVEPYNGDAIGELVAAAFESQFKGGFDFPL